MFRNTGRTGYLRVFATFSAVSSDSPSFLFFFSFRGRAAGDVLDSSGYHYSMVVAMTSGRGE